MNIKAPFAGNVIREDSIEINGVVVKAVLTDIKTLVKVDFLTFNFEDIEGYINFPPSIKMHIHHETWTKEDQQQAVDFIIEFFLK